jgi:hypothetical protein
MKKGIKKTWFSWQNTLASLGIAGNLGVLFASHAAWAKFQDLPVVLQNHGYNTALANKTPYKIRVNDDGKAPHEAHDLYRTSMNYPPTSKTSPCYVTAAGQSVNHADFISAFADLPRKDTALFRGPDLTYLSVLFHEIGHCNGIQPRSMVAELEEETKADLVSWDVMEEMDGGPLQNKILKYGRAMGAMTYQQTSHMTGLALDAHDKGEKNPDPLSVIKAYQAVFDILKKEGIGPITVDNLPDDERRAHIIRVSSVLDRQIAAETFNHSPLALNAVRLYSEGLQFLAPGLKTTIVYHPPQQ